MSVQFFPTYDQVLRSKFGGFVLDIREYGADPTGTFDSTGPITQACKDAAAQGAVVYAPEGTYICNGATSPVQDTDYLRLVGAGEALTKFICTQTPPGGGGVFNLQMPGEITDITFDGNGTLVGTTPYQVLSVGNGHAGVTWPKTALRRVTCTNINPGVTNNGWNLIVWMSGTGSPIIDTLILEDVTVSGPSATSFDAMAINSFNMCYVTRMNLLSLTRSPNFYQGNWLSIAGLYSNGATGTGSLVLNSGVSEVYADRIVVDASFGTAALSVASPFFSLSNSKIGSGDNAAPGVNGACVFMPSGTGQTIFIDSSHLASGINIQAVLGMLSISNSLVVNGPAGNLIRCDAGVSGTGPTVLDNCVLATRSSGAQVTYSAVAGTVFDLTVRGGSLSPSSDFNGILGPNSVYGVDASVENLAGYNPVGPTAVAVPASGSATAALPYDATFYITQTTAASSVSVQGQTIDIPIGGPTAIRVPAGQTLTPTYSTAPTWVVLGE